MEELRQSPTLGMKWNSPQHSPPHPHPSLEKKLPWHPPQFPSAALLLEGLSPAAGLPFCLAPGGNLGPIWVVPRIIWIHSAAIPSRRQQYGAVH